jgi:hypothetical protein
VVGFFSSLGGKPMPPASTTKQRAALHTTQVRSRNVRHWRRFLAVLMWAEGVPVETVVQNLNVPTDPCLQPGRGRRRRRASRRGPPTRPSRRGGVGDAASGRRSTGPWLCGHRLGGAALAHRVAKHGWAAAERGMRLIVVTRTMSGAYARRTALIRARPSTP